MGFFMPQVFTTSNRRATGGRSFTAYIRPTAIGKKNWLFFGSEEAGGRSAVIYTLIENCRMHGVEPYAYLKDVLERFPTMTNQQVAQLTPLNWKKAQRSPIKLAA